MSQNKITKKEIKYPFTIKIRGKYLIICKDNECGDALCAEAVNKNKITNINVLREKQCEYKRHEWQVNIFFGKDNKFIHMYGNKKEMFSLFEDLTILTRGEDQLNAGETK